MKFISEIFGFVLCFFDIHDTETVYPVRGMYLSYRRCKRAGCYWSANHVRRQ